MPILPARTAIRSQSREVVTLQTVAFVRHRRRAQRPPQGLPQEFEEHDPSCRDAPVTVAARPPGTALELPRIESPQEYAAARRGETARFRSPAVADTRRTSRSSPRWRCRRQRCGNRPRSANRSATSRSSRTSGCRSNWLAGTRSPDGARTRDRSEYVQIAHEAVLPGAETFPALVIDQTGIASPRRQSEIRVVDPQQQPMLSS